MAGEIPPGLTNLRIVTLGGCHVTSEWVVVRWLSCGFETLLDSTGSPRTDSEALPDDIAMDVKLSSTDSSLYYLPFGRLALEDGVFDVSQDGLSGRGFEGPLVPIPLRCKQQSGHALQCAFPR